MKDPPGKTKVVVRRLPPAISQSALMEQIDSRFASGYKWVRFCDGKAGQKRQCYSRAYIDFKDPGDVIEFAEIFDGHVFVNEKGTQFKASVEYAPSQRIPKPWSKKDTREGTIFKDPEYLEFLEQLAKPLENLPSAEIQLERKEAARAGASKDTPIITPLMDFVRQKRAAKSGPMRSAANGKQGRKSVGASASGSSPSSKRGSEKSRVTTSTYVIRDHSKNASGREKLSKILATRGEYHHALDKSIAASSVSGKETINDENDAGLSEVSSAASGVIDVGKTVVILKGKQREVSEDLVQPQNILTRSFPGSNAVKPRPPNEGGGRIIKSIFSKKAPCQIPPVVNVSQSDQTIPTVSLEERRPPRPPSVRLFAKSPITGSSSFVSESSGNDPNSSAISSEKHERRMRNRDRPDLCVWAPLCRSEVSLGSDESSLSSQTTEGASDTLETISTSTFSAGIKSGDNNKSVKPGFSPGRNMEIRSVDAGRGGPSQIGNGSHKHSGRRGPIHVPKEVDSSNLSEGKSSKRVPPGHGSHERQVWVQKSGPAS